VNGRRVVHGRDFKRLEKKYIFYEEWMDWHRKVLPLNLRKIMKIKK
jgi:glycine cleavage system aminomethyltransferase T